MDLIVLVNQFRSLFSFTIDVRTDPGQVEPGSSRTISRCDREFGDWEWTFGVGKTNKRCIWYTTTGLELREKTGCIFRNSSTP